MNNNFQARELIKHDGIKDVLTGLLSYQAFLESANREIKAARRSGNKINLFLVTLLETDDKNQLVLAVRPTREISERNQDELYGLAARVLKLSTSVTEILRANDLVARYTFADLLILTSGNYEEVIHKLQKALTPLAAAIVGLQFTQSTNAGEFNYEILPTTIRLNETDIKRTRLKNSASLDELLADAIARLEQHLVTTFSDNSSTT